MQFSIVAIVAVVAPFVAAQGDIPECARPCVVASTSGSSIGGCTNTDVKCICSAPQFLSDISCCVSKACSLEDQNKAIAFANNLCSISGVTNLPTAASCAATPAATTPGTPATAAPPTGTTTPTASAPTSTSATATATAASGAQKIMGLGAGVWGFMMGAAALL
ncbi:hypothetical protein HYALB_00002929 [Hymenoscyphus albidus]|uniref:CFEM domain-containing protein n=1 Tax=Hymenoscyphus albidus TaxID=595503 RepID=A0A9N9M4G6_9HELO|nr:hypothetical protein HYALB_00002929 [Hymenoscyphus albidus]